MGNGPTEDQAEIIQHDQLSQHSENDEHEVRNQDTPSLHSVGLAYMKYVTRVVYYNVGPIADPIRYCSRQYDPDLAQME